ncbi:MAG TPA: YdeI/OmpD-associated family protein [Vicinamibacterales bacterium]|nr:YdeI/OmpD-associated family protein [Vicinamibacterales bacterium]
MADLKKVQPKSRSAWRVWLEKHHAASQGIWLVFAKKHTGLPTLSYEEAVQEALCFGWIDSLMKSIDDRFHMQMFTPRKPKSRWSATNKARLAKLMKAGVMAPAGLAAVEQAKKSGSWTGYASVDALTIPPELKRALEANPDAKKNWPNYSASARRSFLHMVNDAKRPETRAKYVKRVIDLVANNVSMTEIRKQAMGGKKTK